MPRYSLSKNIVAYSQAFDKTENFRLAVAGEAAFIVKCILSVQPAMVAFYLSPDYSELGDIDDIENNYRIKKARVVSLWLTTEMNAIVIPHITFPTISTIDFYLDGLEDCSVVAFSTKGYVDDKLEKEILIKAVKYTVDRLNLRTIIVYDVCRENYEAENIFRYAIDKGINIIIPPNMIKNRNQARRKKNASR